MAPIHTSLESELVVVANFDTVGDAHVARTALESLGIEAVVADEQGRHLGGIRLVIRAQDAQLAREFLDHVNAGRDPRFFGGRQRCPHCWSYITSLVTVRRLALRSWLRKRGPLFVDVERLRCGSCGRYSGPDTARP